MVDVVFIATGANDFGLVQNPHILSSFFCNQCLILNATNAVDIISDLPDANRSYPLLIHLSNVGFPLPD